ncbi:hypothetical protein BDR03DRAFT_985989 [Suillus americanus]|nr:hypothetical protein BDR03DRAFT_985989 [Suillus americanus]
MLIEVKVLGLPDTFNIDGEGEEWGLLLRKDSSEKDEGNYRLDFGLRAQKALKRLKGTQWCMPVVVENENNAIKHAPMDFGGRGQDMRRMGDRSFEGALEGDERRRKAPKYDKMHQSATKGAKIQGMCRNAHKRWRRLESLQLRGTWLLTVLITRCKNMAPFNLALLTMTPSPEPEECPSLLVKAPTLPKEVEESFEARALRVWAGLRERLDTLIKVMPDDDPALFVDRESWTRDWNELLESLSEVGVKSANDSITLELDDEGLAQLAEGKCAYCAFSREIRGMKSKAIAEPVPSTPPRARRSQAKMVPEVTAPAKKDAEEKLVMCPCARMLVPKAPCCTRCSEGKLMCGGQPGKRCPPCNKGKKLCLFSRVTLG